MNKAELLSLANKGKVEINGIPLEIVVRPSSVDGEPWIEITVDPLSPLHQPLRLGSKWVEYITDEECAELPLALEEYKRRADEFCEKAKRVVKAELYSDDAYHFTEVPESVKDELRAWPRVLKRFLQGVHRIDFIGQEKEFWRAPGKFTLELNGIQYVPHWSYWLECVYYIADDQIKRIGGNDNA